MNNLCQLLQENGFPGPYDVSNRKTVSNIWKKQRCGIYVLHFSSGDYYVGQSLDVTKRFQQHRKIWDDIEKISFKRVAKKNLNVEEETLIKLLEDKDYQLRNIVFTTPGKIPKGMSDFDLIMAPDVQERWLMDTEFNGSGGGRNENKGQRQKYTRKYQRFMEMPHSEEVIQTLREYVQRAIPAYRASEMVYWSCTCLLSKHGKDIVTYCRINLNWQVVLTAYTYKEKPEYSVYMAKSVLDKGSRVRNFMHKTRLAWKGAWSTKHQYKPGGQDQINFFVYNSQDMLELLKTPETLRAIRLFNLRLMRQGPCVSSQFHCYDLADRLV